MRGRQRHVVGDRGQLRRRPQPLAPLRISITGRWIARRAAACMARRRPRPCRHSWGRSPHPVEPRRNACGSSCRRGRSTPKTSCRLRLAAYLPIVRGHADVVGREGIGRELVARLANCAVQRRLVHVRQDLHDPAIAGRGRGRARRRRCSRPREPRRCRPPSRGQATRRWPARRDCLDWKRPEIFCTRRGDSAARCRSASGCCCIDSAERPRAGPSCRQQQRRHEQADQHQNDQIDKPESAMIPRHCQFSAIRSVPKTGGTVPIARSPRSKMGLSPFRNLAVSPVDHRLLSLPCGRVWRLQGRRDLPPKAFGLGPDFATISLVPQAGGRTVDPRAQNQTWTKGQADDFSIGRLPARI